MHQSIYHEYILFNQLCGGIVVLVVCGGGIVGLGTLISYNET